MAFAKKWRAIASPPPFTYTLDMEPCVFCIVPDWHALFIWWLCNGSQSKDSFLLGWQITIKTLQKTDNNIKLIFRHFRVTHVWSCCWFIIILERKWRYDFLHSLQIKHFSDLNYQELKINEWSSIEVIFEICNWDAAMDFVKKFWFSF